jgi:hypothetical protein
MLQVTQALFLAVAKSTKHIVNGRRRSVSDTEVTTSAHVYRKKELALRNTKQALDCRMAATLYSPKDTALLEHYICLPGTMIFRT